MRGRQWVILFGKAEYALSHRSAVGGGGGNRWFEDEQDSPSILYSSLEEESALGG